MLIAIGRESYSVSATNSYIYLPLPLPLPLPKGEIDEKDLDDEIVIGVEYNDGSE